MLLVITLYNHRCPSIRYGESAERWRAALKTDQLPSTLWQVSGVPGSLVSKAAVLKVVLQLCEMFQSIFLFLNSVLTSLNYFCSKHTLEWIQAFLDDTVSHLIFLFWRRGRVKASIQGVVHEPGNAHGGVFTHHSSCVFVQCARSCRSGGVLGLGSARRTQFPSDGCWEAACLSLQPTPMPRNFWDGP